MRLRSLMMPIAVLALAGCGAEAPCLYLPYCASHTLTVKNDCGETIEWVLSEAESEATSAWNSLENGEQGSANTRFVDPYVHVRLPDTLDSEMVIPWMFEDDEALDEPLVLEEGYCPWHG